MHLVQATLSKCVPTRGFIYEYINRKLKFSALMNDDFLLGEYSNIIISLK